MATKTFTRIRPAEGHDRIHVITWEGMTTGDVGEPFTLSQLADRSVQVVGNFGGASVAIEGSIDGTNYSTLTDPQGNKLEIMSAKIEAITELVRFIRPAVSGGASVDVDVHMLMRLS